MAKLDFPSSPTAGQQYAAPNGVTYTWDDTIGIGVWTAKVTGALSLSSNGSISGTAQVGSTLTYSTGTATGGTSPYTYSWEWRLTSDNSVLQTDGSTLVVPSSAAGDTIYIFLTATDAAAATATGSTSAYPVPPNVITYAPFPNTSFTPSTGPNATPAATNIPADPLGNLQGTALTTNWNDGSPTLNATNMLMSIGSGVAPVSASISPVPSDIVNVAWDPAYIAGITDGNTATGSFTDGTYTNSYSFVVDKQPAFTMPADTGAGAASATIDTGVFTPNNFNCTVPLTYAAGATPMTNVQASINGGVLVNVPTSGTTLTVDPGDTVRIYADLGAAAATYSITVNMGASSQPWDETVALVPYVTAPTISAPTNGATNVNPALNSPAAVPVTASAFSSGNGAGTNHASSDWELATDSGFATIVYSSIGDTTNLTTWSIPQANLTTSTTYYLRVRYNSGTTGGVATTSPYSTTVSFTTNNSFTIPPGTAMGGGYFAGQINDGGTIYNLIVAPITEGALEGQYGGATPATIQWKTVSNGDANPPSQNEVYGQPATTTFTSATYPMFNWCVSSATGPNAGTFDATNAAGTGIGGFNDWYIPAKNELEILYYNLKPDTTSNDTSSGINPNAVPARASNYTAGTPAQTANALFQTSGAQAFSPAYGYWSSTEYSGVTSNAWRQGFSNGVQASYGKSNAQYARAVRRIAA